VSAAFEFAPFLKAFADLGLEAMAMDVERGVAGDIVDRAKSIVHTDSGETRDSLAIQGEGMDAKGPWIDVGSKLPKAFYEEFGSIHGAPVAFLRTAIAEAMSGRGGFGVSWSKMHRPPHSRNRKRSH
jgi:hypothetical protein